MDPTSNPPSTIPEISKSRNFCRFRAEGSVSGAFFGIMGPKNGSGFRNLHPGSQKSRNLEIFAASAWEAPLRGPFLGSWARKTGATSDPPPRIPEIPKSRIFCRFRIEGSVSGASSGAMGPENGPNFRSCFHDPRHLGISTFSPTPRGKLPKWARKWTQLQILHPGSPKSRNLDIFAGSA